MIDKKWQTKKLEELISIKHGFAFKSEFFSNHGNYVLLTPGNFYESGGFRDICDQKKYYTGPFPQEYLLSHGSLLIVMTEQAPGLLGSAIIIPRSGKYLHNQRLGLVIIADPQTIYSEFLFHLFNSPLLRKPISETASGTKVRHTSPTRICEIFIDIPSLLEQERIAAILSKWDRAIDLTEQRITAKQERRTWLMQQLLSGKRRLQGFGKRWREVNIKELFEPVRRKNTIGATRVLTASGEHGLVDQTDYFNRSVAGDALENYFSLRRGEFAYNRSSMNGYPYGAIKRLDEYDDGVLSTLYICFKPASGDVFSDYYKHLFEGGVLNSQLRMIVQVGARAHGLLNVTVHDFFSLRVPCPPIEEQRKIAGVIDVAERELNLLHAQLDALRDQKKGLMQQLLTGKLRVKI